jgi:predicted nucleic acid-binding protein
MKKEKKQQKKILIFDSSSIISLALNNLLYLLSNLRKKYNVRFVITQDVKQEIIDKPLRIRRYELEALMIRELLNNDVLRLHSIDNKKIVRETTKIMKIANRTFRADNRFMKIISRGEASCFALSRMLRNKGMKSILVIDERTARMLAEKPENLHSLLEKKLHREIKPEIKNFSYFSGFKIIRSAELCYIAYKQGLVGIKDGKQLIDALLYAVKYKGCAISNQEIEEVKRLS